MASFPTLKTTAIAQYPAGKELRFRNQVLRFLDGAEQRYRDASGPLRRWQIRLSALDEREMAALEAFFATQQGCFGSFAFTDPWDSETYPDCSFAGGELALTSVAEMNGQTFVMIVENRR
jgi:uncharacterized protein DUF2460